MSAPTQPVVHEVNTAVWLGGLSRGLGRPVTLGDVPDEAWDAVVRPGIDAVWLMGVWERSAAGLALVDAGTRQSFRRALPDLRDDDVIGSPYCVRRYEVDERFGGRSGLWKARAALARRGALLVLDYVPNHVAPDHPWVTESPELFVRGSHRDLVDDPEAWLAVGGRVLARGRDPYFPPWPDVVQLDAFSPAMRAATVRTLSDIAGHCDAIRCDMAMLPTNDVFARTWRGRTGPPPETEFWPEVLGELRTRHPDTLLIAEAYWDLEWTLQQQGFDLCYDKRLYDRVTGLDPNGVRDHLRADPVYQSRLLRFLENHDEPRAASRLPREAVPATAVVLATLPGGTLWHEGQFEGRRTRVPVFLDRAPDEPDDTGLAAWHHRLVGVANEVRRGTWQLLDLRGWPDNRTRDNLLAWSWTAPDARTLVVVNLSPVASQGRVVLPWTDLADTTPVFRELLRDDTFHRDGQALSTDGLYVDLPPWGHHVVSVDV
ncbi:alpha-amylase [Actinosynnema sp. NPDC047251]|uniref:Alpha-amylase n=1 Tax=Saccharothrix espanaensis (strain ATCC 51144 / DSM 44229 / JCM 9112 / NBRC 15066 / NRRL 15764) TaxID=1179773 RepID=K0K531_SACES|nr:alpha-amylase [Saccharothrix espanaensis]CCH31974.1 alpha-amylase [Saccharothrix espanaensis DSM 44229]